MSRFRSAFPAVALAAFALASPAIARGDTPAQAKAAIQKVLDGWDAAAARKDAAGMAANHTPDFVRIDGAGRKRTAAEIDRETRQQLPSLVSYKAKTVIQSLTVSGNWATVVTKSSGTAVVKDPKDKAVTVAFPITATDRSVWVKRNGKWLEKESRTVDAAGK
jgi:ketosteroid isomerase-like protein